jgi:hypothetical protein
VNKKYWWLPIDERLIPDIFSFQYPKSRWVRFMLEVEMVLAVLAVIGTLILTLLPRSSTVSERTVNATSQPQIQK